MSGDQLDLDAIEAWIDDVGGLSKRVALRALVAEVRRLRAQVERVESLAGEWERNERDADPWYWSDAAVELRDVIDFDADTP